MNLDHLRRLLQSKNPKVQALAIVIAILSYFPTFTAIWDDPEMSIAAKVGKTAQGTGWLLGAIALVAIKPEDLEDKAHLPESNDETP